MENIVKNENKEAEYESIPDEANNKPPEDNIVREDKDAKNSTKIIFIADETGVITVKNHESNNDVTQPKENDTGALHAANKNENINVEKERSFNEYTNNLELVLDELCQRHIGYEIEQEEVDFIRDGVEHIVEAIARLTLEKANDIISRFTEGMISGYARFSDVYTYEQDLGDRILKVGSFYEGTKLKYPDEFDFLFVLDKIGISLHLEYGYCTMDTNYAIHIAICELVCKNYSSNFTFSKGNRHIKLEGIRNSFLGPAVKLNLLYFPDFIEKADSTFDIKVDFTPCFQIIDANIDSNVGKICSLPGFYGEVVDTDGFIVLLTESMRGTLMSFTLAELYFMKEVLSEKHKKVYKLLKFIINGHGIGEELEQMCKSLYVFDVHITSNQIKNAVIFHHYECKHESTCNLAPCLLDIMEQISTCIKQDKWMNIVKYMHMCDNMYDDLKLKYGICKQFDDMICDLKSIRDTDKPYDRSYANSFSFFSYSMMLIVNSSLGDMAIMRSKMLD